MMLFAQTRSLTKWGASAVERHEFIELSRALIEDDRKGIVSDHKGPQLDQSHCFHGVQRALFDLQSVSPPDHIPNCKLLSVRLDKGLPVEIDLLSFFSPWHPRL